MGLVSSLSSSRARTIWLLDTMLLIVSFALALASLVSAQDTYHCPDNWEYHEGHGHGACFFVEHTDHVSKYDAEILCGAHGGWLLELDHPGLNYWIKSLLQNVPYEPKAGVPWGNQFWIGGITEDHHSDHVNGNWRWPHANKTVDWFDWGEGEPNDFHTQFCMSFMEFRNPLFPIYRDFFWNDWNCDEVARFICQKPCEDTCP